MDGSSHTPVMLLGFLFAYGRAKLQQDIFIGGRSDGVIHHRLETLPGFFLRG